MASSVQIIYRKTWFTKRILHIAMELLQLLYFFLLWHVAFSAKSDCVDKYLDFQEQTFSNNSENRLKLYQAFYPPNDHLPYSVIVFYQTLLPNGTRVNISTDHSCPNEQAWMWLSSPVFLFTEPVLANWLSLYALSYFQEWDPPKLLINIPRPCEENAKNFLNHMTCSLQAYALGEHMDGQHLAYVDHGCGADITNIKLEGHSTNTDLNFNAKVIAAITGILFVSIFMQLSSVLLVKVTLQPMARKTSQYSYEHYGNFWGITTSLCIASALICYSDLSAMSRQILGGKLDVHMYYMYLLVLIPTFTTVFNIAAAIYIAINATFAAPSIYFLPAKLLCCCNKKRALVMLTVLTIWASLGSIQLILAHGIILLLFMPVAPFSIFTYALLLILILTCVSHVLALLFTVAASVCTPKHNRHVNGASFIAKALVLIPLLIAAICFGVVLAFSGTFVNSSTKQDSFLLSFRAIFIPVFLGSMSFGLKAFIARWLKSPPRTADSLLQSLPDDIMVHP